MTARRCSRVSTITVLASLLGLAGVPTSTGAVPTPRTLDDRAASVAVPPGDTSWDGRLLTPTLGYNCTGAPPKAKPGTEAWEQREVDEAQCGEQRFTDTSHNPAFAAAEQRQSSRSGGYPPEDPFRDPGKLSGHRFRFRRTQLPDPTGSMLPSDIFLPCSPGACTHRPKTVVDRRGPYPAVVLVHGGGASMQHYLWAEEGLAETGFMVLTFQVPASQNTGSRPFPADTEAALNFLFSTPRHKDGAVYDPAWRDLARRHVGVAGHSGGAYGAIVTGQKDSRVKAVVSWDRAKSTPIPAHLRLRHPTLFTVSDYQCQEVPVCVSQPYTSPPPFDGPGDKDRDFTETRAAGVDTMKVGLRDGTHLDYTQFVPGTGSRYGADVAFYYTLAWFDHYLLGRMAHRRRLERLSLHRLIARRFDDSADIHNISGGRYDATTGANVPARIAGQPITDRLSFHFRSGFWLDHGKYRCGNMLTRCG